MSDDLEARVRKLERSHAPIGTMLWGFFVCLAMIMGVFFSVNADYRIGKLECAATGKHHIFTDHDLDCAAVLKWPTP